MNNTIIKCPTCGNPHGLFLYVQKGGKKEVSYRCNKVERSEVETKYGTIDATRFGTAIKVWLEPVDAALVLPEEWSPAYKEEVKNKDQGQFTLMYKGKK